MPIIECVMNQGHTEGKNSHLWLFTENYLPWEIGDL